MSALFQNNVVSGSILRLSVRVNECYLFQDLTIERKNACFIAQRCLNRYKIDKFCTIERKMEDIFVQRNNLLSLSKDSNSLILQTSAVAESLPQLRCGPLPLTAEGGKVFRIKELMNNTDSFLFIFVAFVCLKV